MVQLWTNSLLMITNNDIIMRFPVSGIYNCTLSVISFFETWLKKLLNYFFGLFVDFEIVHPVLSDISGNIVSHSQLHGNRFKRDSSRTDTLYLNITGQGQKFEIHLNENRNLLAPGFKVYHRKRSKDSPEVVETLESSSGGPYHQSTTCHYSGREKSRGGRAALSLCDGLVSVIYIV